MDTSETYINMCEEARKFLPEWIPQEGDSFCCRGKLYVYQRRLYLGAERNEDCFPLYRQDQLQEMIGDFETTMFVLLDAILAQEERDFSNKGIPKHSGAKSLHELFGSWEQLWLAFVMNEKYNKVWNGEEWHSAQI